MGETTKGTATIFGLDGTTYEIKDVDISQFQPRDECAVFQEAFDPESMKITLTGTIYFNMRPFERALRDYVDRQVLGLIQTGPTPDALRRLIGDRWLDSAAVKTFPRTDRQARRRLPAAPGVQLLYVGMRAWGKSIEQSFLDAVTFARSLGLL